MFDSQTLTSWVLLPLLIFSARAFDVSLGTLRIIFIAQGYTKWAPLVGFFETLIWLLIVNEALVHVSNPLCAVAYAGGFATGNAVGLKLEGRLAMGRRLIRVILPNGYEPGEDRGPDVVAELRAGGFGVTVVHGEGLKGPVRILFTVVKRADVPRAMALVEKSHPHAFLSVEDVRHASGPSFPGPLSPASGRLPWHWLGKSR